jgi:hypothetical protein
MKALEVEPRNRLVGGSPELPVRVPRDRAAELVTQHFFKISHRSLERAPLRWQLVNGKAHVLTSDLFTWAESVLAASPIVMGGRRHADQDPA